jgi:hypothetical protein
MRIRQGQLRRLPIVALLFLSQAVISSANAATVQFAASATFTDSFHDVLPLSGSLTVDTTTGLLAAADLMLVGEPWTKIVSQGFVSSNYSVDIQTNVPNAGCFSGLPACFDTLSLLLSTGPNGLVQNGGGLILSGLANLLDAGFSIQLSGTGTLTSVSPVPLPSALPLFAAGLGIMGLFIRRRKRRRVGAECEA